VFVISSKHNVKASTLSAGMINPINYRHTEASFEDVVPYQKSKRSEFSRSVACRSYLVPLQSKESSIFIFTTVEHENIINYGRSVVLHLDQLASPSVESLLHTDLAGAD